MKWKINLYLKNTWDEVKKIIGLLFQRAFKVLSRLALPHITYHKPARKTWLLLHEIWLNSVFRCFFMLYLNGAVFTYPEKPWLEKKLVLKFKKKPDFPSISAAVAASTHKLTPPLTHAHNNMHVWWSTSHLLVCKNNMFRMRRQKRASPCSVQLRSNMHSNHVQDLFMFMLFLCLPVYRGFYRTTCYSWNLLPTLFCCEVSLFCMSVWSNCSHGARTVNHESPRDRALAVDHFMWDIRSSCWAQLAFYWGLKEEFICSYVASRRANKWLYRCFVVFGFWFSDFKMHNFTLDICFELNGDDNWLSAQTGKTLTHKFCFQFSWVQ